MSALHTMGWLVAIVYSTVPSYWLVVHSGPKRWQSYRKPLLVLGPIWMLMWIVAAVITWPWHAVALYETRLGWIAAAPLFAVGIYLYGRGTRQFSSDQVLGRSEIQPQRHVQSLNTTGVRARVRHPLYLAHLCETIAWAVGTGLAVVYALLAFGVFTGYFMVRAEERELEARFGETYREYKRRAPAIVPKL